MSDHQKAFDDLDDKKRVIPITYTLSGQFELKTPAYIKDLPEISRRAAVIIACNLFSADELKSFKKFRPFIASNVYKTMSTFLPEPTEVYNDCIPNWWLRINLKSFTFNNLVVENEVQSEDDFFSDESEVEKVFAVEVEGCQELVVANECIVIISYKLSLEIKQDSVASEAELAKDGYKISPEPHYSWVELLNDVDKSHSDNNCEGFSATLTDAAISLDVRCRPITYVRLEEKKHSHRT